MTLRKEYFQKLNLSSSGTPKSQYQQGSIQTKYLNTEKLSQHPFIKSLTKSPYNHLQRTDIYTQPFNFTEGYYNQQRDDKEKQRINHLNLKGELLYQKQMEIKLKREINQLMFRRNQGKVDKTLTPRTKQNILTARDKNILEQTQRTINDEKTKRQVSPSRVSNQIQQCITQYKRKIQKYKYQKQQLETVKRYLQSENMRLVTQLSNKCKSRQQDDKLIDEYQINREKMESEIMMLKISQQELKLSKVSLEEEIEKLKMQGVFALNQWVQEKIKLQSQIKSLKHVQNQKQVCLESSNRLKEQLCRIRNEDIQDLNNQIQELKSIISGLESKNIGLENRYEDFMNQIESKNLEIVMLKQSIDKAVEKQRIKCQIIKQSMSDKLNQSQEEKASLKQKIIDLEAKFCTLTDQNNNNIETISQMTQNSQTINFRLEEYTKINKQQQFIMSQQLRQIYSLKQSKVGQQQQYKKQLNIKEIQIQQLKQENKTLTEANNQQLKQQNSINNQQYIIKIQHLKNQNNQLQSNSKIYLLQKQIIINEKQQQIIKLTNEIQTYKQKLREYQRQIVSKQQRQQFLQSVNKQQDEGFRQKCVQNQILQLSIQDKNEEISELIQVLEQYKQTINQLNHQSEMYKNTMLNKQFTFNNKMNKPEMTEEQYEKNLFTKPQDYNLELNLETYFSEIIQPPREQIEQSSQSQQFAEEE